MLPNLRPSGAARRLQCAASVRAELPFLDAQTPDPIQEEGTRGHEWAAHQILALLGGNGGITPVDDVERAALEYVDFVVKLCRRAGVFGGPNLGVEQHVECQGLLVGYGGTPDFYLYDQKIKRLYIVDLKLGYITVEAERNAQLIDYSKGIIGRLKIDPKYISVELIIVQPRAWHPLGPIRRWVVNTADALTPAWEASTQSIVDAINGGTYRTGPQCRNCLARMNCSAFATRTSYDLEATSTDDPGQMTPRALGLRLTLVKEAISRLEWLLTSLEAESQTLIEDGTVVPGWHVTNGRGSTAWTQEAATVIAAGDLAGVNVRKPEAPITPKQAITAGLDENIVKAFSESRPGRPILKPAADTLAGRVFKPEV